MADVIISVRGDHEARVAPERAVAHLTIRAEGSERGAVVERLVALTEPVRDDLIARKENGSVAEWTSQQVRVWSERPWNNEGKRLAPVHYASVDFAVTFTDFPTLSWWAGETMERDGVQFGWIDWQLTPQTRAETERAVAAGAVEVAVERARAYAGAIGLYTVTPIQIADLGLLAGPEAGAVPSAAPKMMRGMAMDAAGSGAAVDLQPTDLVVAASVEARFTAS